MAWSLVWSGKDTEEETSDYWLDVSAAAVIPENVISATVKVETDESGSSSSTETVPTITGYSYAITPEAPSGLVVEVADSGITVSAPDTLAKGFPIQDIEYQINREEFHCYAWADVPAEADEIIRYIPYPQTYRDWTITATAHLSNGESGSAEYVLHVTQNYDPGKIALQEAVDARR